MNFDYNVVVDKLNEDILNGKFVPGEKIPSERELCDQFLVSRTTIRKAIEQLVAKRALTKKPGKGTFVNTVPCKKILLTGNILFLRCTHSDIGENSTLKDDVIYSKILSGIEREASTTGNHCIIKTTNERKPDFNAIEEAANKVDGIICGELHSKAFLTYLTSLRLPLVLITPSVTGDTTDIVEIADKEGAYSATKRLIENGHSEIGFIGGAPRSFPAKKRKEGFFAALKGAGIPSRPELFRETNWNIRDGYDFAKELLQNSNKPTAIFAASDLLALGAFNAIIELGMRIPDDVSLIGFDGIDTVSHLKPSLATMQIRTHAIGKTALKMLHEQINGHRDYALRLSIPTKMIEGKSIKSIRE